MKKELEKLWYSYLYEKPITRTKEEITLIKNLLSAEKKFLSTLSPEQEKLFDIYDTANLKMNSISEKNAFIKGVTFATHFLIESIYD